MNNLYLVFKKFDENCSKHTSIVYIQLLFTYLIDFLDDKRPIVEFDRSRSSEGLAGLLLTESRAGAKLRADNYNIGGACH